MTIQLTGRGPKLTYQLCEFLFSTDDGRPWLLTKMPYFIAIYEDKASKLLLKTSRQSTKTTFLRNMCILRSLLRPGNSSLYVAPTQNQVRDFSKKKLDTVFSYNPDLKKACTSPKLDWNVTFKQLKVGSGISTINLRSTGGHQGAEGIRGGVYNDIFKDEFQSHLEEHIPVINECAATFDGRDGRPKAYYVNTGTPMGRNNPIEKEWNRSIGYEWCIKCVHCQRFNEPLGMQHIDPKKPYLFCQFCGKDVSCNSLGQEILPQGEWVATNPNGRFPGYRLVRLMMPWARWRSDNDDGILDRLATWPERRFANEVMGLPFDDNQQPITERELRACCQSYRLPETEFALNQLIQEHASHPKFAGLDWAMNADESTPSYTKFGVFAQVNGKLKLLFAYSFTGRGSSNPDAVLQQVGQWMNRFEIDLLACDYGVGYFENQRLRKQYPDRVITMHYTGSSQRVKTQYDAAGPKYMVPRTPSLDELFSAIKTQHFVFPEYENVRHHLEDLLRVTLEISEASRTVVYRRNGTDDFAHVMNYAHLASRLYSQGRFPGFYGPTRIPSGVYSDGRIGY